MAPRLFSPDDPRTPLAYSDGPLRLQAELTYTVEGEPADLEAIADALPPDLTRRCTDRTLQLAFGNAVGRFDLPHLGAVDVFTGKLGEDDYTRMLEQLADELAELPLEAGTAAHGMFERDEDPARLRYLAFLYLRLITSDQAPARLQLVPALQVILHHPHRRLMREPLWVPLERTRHIDPGRLHQLVAARAGLARSPSNLALATTLRGHLPNYVEEAVPRTDLDVPENRFVRHVLDLAQDLVRTFRALARDRPSHFRRRLEADCDQIARALAPIDRHPLWSELSPMARLPLDSTVLQRARGYKDIFRHYLRLRQSTRLPLEPARAAELLELKDIATLYELWTYFTVARALRDILGPPSSSREFTRTEFSANAKWGFHLTWPHGHVLYYNVTFSRRSKRYSYSVQLRPDITLELASGPNAGLHLFDAKFRLYRVDDPLADDDPDQATFRRDDIHKMHTYRDALGARTVWILYPGTVFKFYPTGREYPLASTPSKLPPVPGGVGSIPLIPAELLAPDLSATLLHLLGPTTTAVP
ncbi:DUF2357 domain-containing protein [Nannocystis sp. ILAH1]|uniref:DUF2357 domain-containing protein n=1 Tax=Nannocystis sp. ILAH1 TaxID=2996789 RepID=UPI00226EA310|nr:DUF2357 domain-containing protein [Nannocystis sp. ILAH1]MCY0989458.1 DUF2357 domain-containing protein [Nannocystis sp. ILAH1]